MVTETVWLHYSLKTVNGITTIIKTKTVKGM